MAGPRPEQRVRIPALYQAWTDVAFLHWGFDATLVQDALPNGLAVDTWQGRAWVSIVPFRAVGTRASILPFVPGSTAYRETNVRTYVVGPDGSDGVFFFALEADNSIALLGRLAGVQYNLATMELRKEGDSIIYRGHRRWPRKLADYDIRLLPGERIYEPDGLDSWLVGRWRAWSQVLGRWISIPIEHRPWPLHGASLERCDQTLLAAAGIAGMGPPDLVHYSPGVSCRIGLPRLNP